MMETKKTAYLLLALAGLTAAFAMFPGGGRVVSCYYGNWAVYRDGVGKFDVEDIDPFICTHVFYAFAGLNASGLMVSLDPAHDLYDNNGKGAYKRFTNLKKKNPFLKTLLSVGGGSEGTIKYSNMVSTAAGRKNFLKNAVKFLKQYGFDGLDFDWEFPVIDGGSPADKDNFSKFLREMRHMFDRHGLMMTAAVSAGKDTVDASYDVPVLGKYLDLIHVMCYDFHGSYDPYTGHNSPLYRGPYDTGNNVTRNGNFSMHYWIEKGAPKHKLVMGIPLYGRTFTLDDENQAGLYAPAQLPGTPGPFTNDPGFISYYEICEQIKANKAAWKITRDPFVKAPYAVNGKQWVGYDDPKSVKTKAEYAAKLGVRGVMVWSLETDDFHGICHGRDFPLMRSIRKGLKGRFPFI